MNQYIITEEQLKAWRKVGLMYQNSESFDIKSFQQYHLDVKISITKELIKHYYSENNGKVYVSFSGGMDSNVLLHLSREIIPSIKGVFSNTGLEYPEIVSFVKTFDNIDIVKPKMRFGEVIEKHGYPVISKRVSRFIKDLQNPTDKNENVRNLRLTGESRVTQPGKIQKSMMIPNKWKFLIHAPFKISDSCCDKLKKEPLNRYAKETGCKRIIGVMADESEMRMQQARREGWSGKDLLQPMIFWTRLDVLAYTKLHNLSFCKIYGNIIDGKNGLDTTGEHRTGCMFCMFGVHLEKGDNRFQRMKITHPNQYNYCIDKLGCGKVLDYIGVKY
jgi:3'-phosphoadenosine 5'-phosphosulfate sulfotransferase (PAPS reductase)/FAD synthetase